MVVWKVFKSMFLWIENMYSRSIQGAWSWGRQGEQLPLPPHTHFFPEITGTQKENVDLKSLKCVL